MITKIRRVGNSAGFTIPSHTMKEMNLAVGTEMEMGIANGVITIKPVQPKRRGRSEISLEWLLKDYRDPAAERQAVPSSSE